MYITINKTLLNPFLFFIFLSTFVAKLDGQTVRYVPSVYPTISIAIDSAKDGDTIDITGSRHESNIIVNKNLIIRGHDSTKTRVTSTSFLKSVFNISKSKKVTIEKMTIDSGSYGIYSDSAGLIVRECMIRYNRTTNIYNRVSLAADSVFIYNSNLYGGVANNTGTSVYNGSGKMTIFKSKVHSHIVKANSPSPVFNDSTGIMTMRNDTINDNIYQSPATSSPGICNRSKMQIDSCILTGNENLTAGVSSCGIIINSVNADLVISNSKFKYNKIQGSNGAYNGIIYNNGRIDIRDDSMYVNTIVVGNGAAIFNFIKGNLNLLNCNLSVNYGWMSGVFNKGNAIISNCIIDSCSYGIYSDSAGLIVKGCSIADFYTAGIYNRVSLATDSVSIYNTTFYGGIRNKTGTAIYNGSGKMYLESCLVHFDSTKTTSPDNIYNNVTGIMTVNRCTVSDNIFRPDSNATAGIGNDGKMLIENCRIVRNTILSTGTAHCGAITNRTNADLTIYKSTIDSNILSGWNRAYGAGVFNNGRMKIIESEINYNSNFFGEGGGFCNFTNGTLNVFKSDISKNYNREGYGGGFSNHGNAVISWCTVSYDSIFGNFGAYGGGIYNKGILTVDHSDITFNYNHNPKLSMCGSGITNDSVILIYHSRVSGNTTNSDSNLVQGIGIFNEKGICTINESEIDSNFSFTLHNVEGIGIYNQDSLIIKNSLILNNYSSSGSVSGGGIYNMVHPLGQITIDNSTIYNNTATDGGGIYNNRGNIAINNSTITGNSAWNQSGGIYNNPWGHINMKNSILANNFMGFVKSYDYFGRITSKGYNLVGQSIALDFVAKGDTTGADPKLDSLRFNGGHTRTCALLSGSPAINTANDTDLNGKKVYLDQRNYLRSSPNDKGAFEKDGRNDSILQIAGQICNDSLLINILHIWFYVSYKQDITQFIFKTSGTNHPTDITRARLFYTDSSNHFSDSIPFGSAFISPLTSFSFTDTISLDSGWHNFWLTYDIKRNSVKGDTFDASCIRIVSNADVSHPPDSTPAGVRFIPAIYPQFHVADSAECFRANSFSFLNTTSSNVTVLYKWNFGDSLTDTNTNTIHSYLRADSFHVKLIATSNKGCSDSTTQTVFVYPNPKSNFTFTDSMKCHSLPVSFINKSSINPASVLVYKWFFGDGDSAVSILDTLHHYNLPGSYNAKLVAVSNHGCTDTSAKVVHIFNNLLAGFRTNADTQCLNGNQFIFRDTSFSCIPIDSVSWDLNGDGVFGDAKGDSVVQSYGTTGKVRIGIKVYAGAGFDTISRTITIHSNPKAGFTINSLVQLFIGNLFKVNDTSTIFPPEPMSCKFLWGDASFSPNKTDSHSYTHTGVFTITDVVTSSKGCVDSVKKTVTVIADLSPVISFDSVCFGDLTTITSKTIHVDPVIHYDWAFDPDSIFNDFPDDSVIKYLFTTPGGHIIGLRVITATDTQMTFQNVYVKYKPVAGFTINRDTQGLIGNLFIFKTTTTTPLPVTFSSDWSFGDGFYSTSDSTSHSYLDTGNYNVKLLVVTSEGCSDSIYKTVTVLPVIFHTDYIYTKPCLGDTIWFTNKTIVQNDSVLIYAWDFDDGYGSLDSNPIHIFHSPGTYNVKLIVLTKHGAKDSIIKTITINGEPFLNFTFSGNYYTLTGDTVKIYETYNINIQLNGLYDSILWNTGARTDSITADTQGLYRVRAIFADGCFTDTFIYLKILPRTTITFTNVITPNGDLVNDTWRIAGLEMYVPVKLNIFNRWGQEIFATSDYKNDWNGEYKGKKLDAGTYYWIMETKGGKKFKGAINIIR